MWRVVLAVLAGCSFQVGAAAPPGADDAPAGDDAPVVTGDAAPDADLDAPVDAAPALPFMLSGVRWLLPCTSGDLGSHNCNCAPPATVKVALPGQSAQHFMVTARIRGAMEAMTYTGGSQISGAWHVGGMPGDTGNNFYKLQIDHPPQTYWLNPGTPTSQRSFRYDYTVTFMIDGNGSATFTASGQDTLQWANYDGTGPISFAGVTTTPDPYNGQFADLDVEQAVLQ